MDLKEGQNITRRPLLEGNKYGYWRVRMKAFLKSQDESVWEAVEQGWTDPVALDKEGKMLRRHGTFSKLLMKVQPKLKSLEWRPVTSKFENLRMQEDETIADFNTRVLDIANKAFALREPMTEEKLNRRDDKNFYASIKVHMSKAFDRVEWSFLERLLLKLGFADKWVARVMLCVSTVSYQVKVNDKISTVIKPGRGLRQGDPLSPYLFLICTELLNVKPRMNFEKSEVCFSQNTPAEVRLEVCNILRVPQVSCHSKYLGLPLVVGQRKTETLRIIIREDLEESAKTGRAKNGNKGISWLSQNILQRKKCEGGLGFKDLSVFNEAILMKIAWRIVKYPQLLMSQGACLEPASYARSSGDPADWVWNCGASCSEEHFRVLMVAAWLVPPEVGCIKINSDGSWDVLTRRAGIGVVARDHSGAVLWSWADQEVGCFCAGEVEGRALLRSLELAARFEAKKVTFEVDSLDVCMAVSTGKGMGEWCLSWLHPALRLMHSNPGWTVIFTPREGNQVADYWLTRRVLSFGSGTVLVLFLFVLLVSLAAEDLKVYTDNVNKFKISIPNDWQVGAGEPNGFKSITAFYPEETSTSNVSVVITGLGADFTRLESFGKVSGLDRSWQRPPGVTAKLVDCKSSKGESTKHIYSAIGMASNGWYNRLYTVTGQFVEEESEKFGSEIQKAVASFKFI
ncbi:unnamed protein product [Rhodiola kirilowii]